MHQLASHLSSMLKSFKEQVLEHSAEGLVPELNSNVQLSSECVNLGIKKVLEQEDFFQFHKKLEAGNEVGNGECQCLRVPST